jgi:hypothetical protein
MSKLSSLITSLVLSGSSVAAASPSVTYTAAPRAPVAAPIVRDYDHHRLPERASQWTLLGTARLANRWSTVDVSNSARFQKLEIKARTGALRISRVLITFANGDSQMVAAHEALYAGKPLVIDLEGRRGKKIDKVTVFGRGSDRATYQVLAI